MPHPIIAGLALAIAAMAPAIVAADALSVHLGRARILVVFASHPGDDGLLAQRRVLDQDRAGTTDRDLVLVPVIGTGEEATALRRRYGVEPGRFQVVLIGKDGSVHLRSATPFERSDLFLRIDAMPMRRAEIRERGR